ncbi:MAG TPA: LysR family transcriptional regulator ArgP [Cellulomonas sp.]
MKFDPDQLAALAAVVEGGTFDAAAAALHVTPSAVSQRVRALERQAGQVLVLRTRPCRPTPAGAVLVRLAGQLTTLDADAAAALGVGTGIGTGIGIGTGAGTGAVRVGVAVNADSLATWFPSALGGLGEEVVVDLHREDQDRTAQLLRDGVVMAAVTSDATPVQGCRSRPLGAMRYRAMAAPAFAARWFPDGPVPEVWVRAPAVAFTADDRLQHRFVESLPGGRPVLGPMHHVPSHPAYVAVIAAGLGWGMVSEHEADAFAGSGTLVDLAPGRHLDVALHWQRWSVPAAVLLDLTERVVAAAAAALRPVAAPSAV